MDTDTIVSFEAPAREGPRIQCRPSPVMELVYAHYYLNKRLHHPRGFEVPWAEPLLTADPELGRAFDEYWAARGLAGPGPELFVLAGRYGYVFDADPARFLADLAHAAARYVRDGTHEPLDDDSDEHVAEAADLQRRIEALRDADTVAAFAGLLRRLWSHLAAGWAAHGQAAVNAAVLEFEAAFDRSGSVLEALPPHHFSRFENLAQPLVEASERGGVVVVPLWLAASGGFRFRVDDTHYVGFGLQSERVFERTAERVGSLARRAKALADPNRLLALALVSTFAGMRPTVGDLAEQIGVSQPTVSGHLRLLRDAGLVAVEKQGNKSFYRLEPEAVRQLLHDLEETLLR
jgi:ArsR family transcriptional regulator, arsenate/arsenite/antimonite-responsive transcriptional repressor